MLPTVSFYKKEKLPKEPTRRKANSKKKLWEGSQIEKKERPARVPKRGTRGPGCGKRRTNYKSKTDGRRELCADILTCKNVLERRRKNNTRE